MQVGHLHKQTNTMSMSFIQHCTFVIIELGIYQKNVMTYISHSFRSKNGNSFRDLIPISRLCISLRRVRKKITSWYSQILLIYHIQGDICNEMGDSCSHPLSPFFLACWSFIYRMLLLCYKWKEKKTERNGGRLHLRKEEVIAQTRGNQI